MEFVRVRHRDDPLTWVIRDDPVRPHIPIEQRVNERAEILVLKNGQDIMAVTCMCWLSTIPESEADLQTPPTDSLVAVFYTIWSYTPGAGRRLLELASAWLREEFKDLQAIVTLSPQTDMARRFHLRNGAAEYRKNADSVNYRYYLKE